MSTRPRAAGRRWRRRIQRNDQESSPHITQNEPLLFERSSPGKIGYQLARSGCAGSRPRVGAWAARTRARKSKDFPEVSEVDAIRHFTRLSTWNYAIDLGLYPLGSCTMKYNPRVNELVARIEGLAWAHPYQPESLSQGMHGSHGRRSRTSGRDHRHGCGHSAARGRRARRVHRHPMIRALLESQRQPTQEDPGSRFRARHQSCHGDDGRLYRQNIKSNERGMVDVEALARVSRPKTSPRMMITNPEHVGVFEENITASPKSCMQRRAGLHGRRQHERAGRRHAARGFRHRRHAPQSA